MGMPCSAIFFERDTKTLPSEVELTATRYVGANFCDEAPLSWPSFEAATFEATTSVSSINFMGKRFTLTT